MKTFKDRKGFTLIELLAVIVVLAIVMVLAVTTVLPLMNNAQENAFVLEANNAREAASNVMTLISINQAGDFNLEKGADYNVSADGTKYCFSLQKLAETGLWKKNMEAVNNKEYEGRVIVTTGGASSNNYTYKVTMHNANYYVSKEGTVKTGDDEIVSYPPTSPESFSCSDSF